MHPGPTGQCKGGLALLQLSLQHLPLEEHRTLSLHQPNQLQLLEGNSQY